MLEKRHIDWYWEDITRARRSALHDIETAKAFAKEIHGENSEYHQFLSRHEEILERTTADLLVLVDSLHEGLRSTYSFSRSWIRDAMVYRGFITDEGKYIPLHKEDHDEYRNRYAEEHGKERAYRMIDVNGQDEKAYVLFCDRKYPPTAAQYATLKELMIDAEGALSFRFVYDINRPN